MNSKVQTDSQLQTHTHTHTTPVEPSQWQIWLKMVANPHVRLTVMQEVSIKQSSLKLKHGTDTDRHSSLQTIIIKSLLTNRMITFTHTICTADSCGVLHDRKHTDTHVCALTNIQTDRQTDRQTT